MRRPWLQKNLLPAAFLTEASGLTREQFMGMWGDTQFLLVKIDDPTGDVLQGLESVTALTSERLKPTRDALAYATMMGDSGTVLGRMDPLHRGRSFSRATLETQLLRSAYFIAPLRKRAVAGKPFVDRISVGRAVNNDIVLRRATVSKFHAWLECDQDHNFYLCDARSSNGTFVNGAGVTSQPVLLEAGAEIRFGDLTATICPPELLWEVIEERA